MDSHPRSPGDVTLSAIQAQLEGAFDEHGEVAAPHAGTMLQPQTLSKNMRIYLDLCCFNRPYDDQSQVRVRLETEAKLSLQDKVRSGECQLVWSAVLDLENSKSPFVEHMQAISQWRLLSSSHVMAVPEVVTLAETLVARGVHAFDALHVASAVVGRADLFITTDDRLLKRVRNLDGIKVFFPAEALAFLENWYEH